MFNINLGITNPFGKPFRNLGFIYGAFTEHKGWEIQHCLDTSCILEFGIDYTIRCDHAGLEIRVGILGYRVDVRIYDGRHWDYKNNTWGNYENN